MWRRPSAPACSISRSATKSTYSAVICATRKHGLRRPIWTSGLLWPARSQPACRGRSSACRTWPPNVSWLTEIAELWPSVQNPPHVTTLTHHYYFGGPATNPEVNIPNLLKPATMAKVQKTADIATAAAGKMGARVRMTEGNTCYRGGKPGVSDVFAAALWSADYSLLLASNNYSGVNLHGGTGKSVANSVGGFLPGDVSFEGARRKPANRSRPIPTRSTRRSPHLARHTRWSLSPMG